MVPHRSTNRARRCLTSMSRREAVLSSWYGRSCWGVTPRTLCTIFATLVHWNGLSHFGGSWTKIAVPFCGHEIQQWHLELVVEDSIPANWPLINRYRMSQNEEEKSLYGMHRRCEPSSCGEDQQEGALLEISSVIINTNAALGGGAFGFVPNWWIQ